MIRYSLFILLLFSAGPTRSQSIGDLITQLVLDAQKLTELKTTLQDMVNGYKVIDKGYTAIKNIAEGNFNLHKAFLDALLAVSPAVRNDPRVSDILRAASSILSEYQAASKQWHADPHFTTPELNYIDDTYSALFHRSIQSIDELTLSITPGQLRMSDAQRLQAIGRAYTDITRQLSFLRQFNNSIVVQAIRRAQEENDILTLQSIYGIHQ
jgi:hypothetical protein